MAGTVDGRMGDWIAGDEGFCAEYLSAGFYGILIAPAVSSVFT